MLQLRMKPADTWYLRRLARTYEMIVMLKYSQMYSQTFSAIEQVLFVQLNMPVPREETSYDCG